MSFACLSSLWIYSFWIASLLGCPAMALHVEWTKMASTAGRISPRRSGHTAFVAIGGDATPRPFVFGGYVEVENDTADVTAAADKAPYKRFVTNDLWEWKKESNKWEPVETATAGDDGHMPGPRLVATTAVLEDKAYLFGGWDPSPEAMASGKSILDTVHVLENLSSGQEQGRRWSRIPVAIPDGPISRHVAVSLPSRQQVLIHSHRCLDYVLLFDPKTLQFTKQPTTGPCPSSRGLHAATVLHSSSSSTSERVVFFGGAAQDQTMSNEAFLLDTATWEWKKLTGQKNNDNIDARPSPRAAPCLCAISDDCVLLFGGAKSTDTGLEPLQDLWALHVTENQWERLLPPPPSATTSKPEDTTATDSSYCCPPPRNAATLTPCSLASSSSSSDDENIQTFMLTGGWAPFRQTWDDCYVLHVYPSNKD